MSGISTTAPLKLENRFKFNGKELNHKEFSDGSGLEWYSYGMREYDAQIGRFFRVDPLATKYTYLTPYQYASNNPIANIDVDGLEGIPFTLTSPFISDLAVQQTLYERNISKGVSSQEAYTQSVYQLMGIKVGEAAAAVGAAYLVSESGIVGAARTLYGLFKGTKKLKSEEASNSPVPPRNKSENLGKRRQNRLPDQSEPNTTQTNKPSTTTKKYGPEGNVQKEFNKGHQGKNIPKNERVDHVHDYKPDPYNPTGRGKRQPGRPPKRNELKKDFNR